MKVMMIIIIAYSFLVNGVPNHVNNIIDTIRFIFSTSEFGVIQINSLILIVICERFN